MAMKLPGLILAMTTLISFAAPAEEPGSMTGTYEGGYACEQTNAGAPAGIYTAAGLKIVQSQAGEIDVALTFDIPNSGSQTLLFKGVVTSGPAANAVSGFFQQCGGSFEATELVRIVPADASRENFSFSADSVFVSTTVPTLEGQLIAASCRYVFRRTDAATPEVDSCN